MKAEINKENKAKFFALYWGQNVMNILIVNALGESLKDEFHPVNTTHNIDSNDRYLALKPLSQISDEDAIEVGKIYEYAGKTTKFQNDHFKLVGKDYVEDTSPDSISLRISDYLRSKSHALPWMGLSVDEMIEAGWIKLIEE